MIRRSTWILLFLFFAIIGFGWYLNQRKQTQAAQATPTTGLEYLLPSDAGVVTGLKIEGKDASIELRRNAENKWEIVLPNAAEADQGMVEAGITQLSTLRVLGRVEIDLELVNLKTPDYKVSVTYSNGQTYTFDVGAVTPINTGYYVRRSDGSVVVVSKVGLDSLLRLLSNPPYPPTPTPEFTPTPTSEGAPPSPTP
uniref:DUF4340 domain-containing protein n=1 Tax=uncultured Chloroflexota bacterium TaxID=166587 RepID=H5SPF4_9CHLR|nr:hypothetical protein HGMM_F48D12C21 [uncultured Chloroflexota bacterium]BAL58040.1 hypothetical protein HGMM_F54B02C05 [uncultured Chloroflexota bacterium]